MTVAGSGSVEAFDQGGTQLFVTLTAPGNDVHYLPNGKACECTPPGGVDLAVWNATSGHRWSRFMQELRRETGLSEERALQYFKGVEVQKRGAVHFHALLRIPEGFGGRHWRPLIRRLAIKHGFGHEIDAAAVSDAQVAGYVAKYASKATDGRQVMPWCDRKTGEKRIGEGRYRVWSASRRWGLSMAQVRSAQRAFAVAAAATAADARAAQRAGGAGAGEAGALDLHASCSTEDGAPP